MAADGDGIDWLSLIAQVEQSLAGIATRGGVPVHSLRAAYVQASATLRVGPPDFARPNSAPADPKPIAPAPLSWRHAAESSRQAEPPLDDKLARSPVSTAAHVPSPTTESANMSVQPQATLSTSPSSNKFACDIEAALAGQITDSDGEDPSAVPRGRTSGGGRGSKQKPLKGSMAFAANTVTVPSTPAPMPKDFEKTPVQSLPVQPPLYSADRPTLKLRLSATPDEQIRQLCFVRIDGRQPESFALFQSYLASAEPLPAVSVGTPCMVQTRLDWHEYVTAGAANAGGGGGAWARAIVERLHTDATAKVYLVDVGRLAEGSYEMDELKPLPRAFGKYAPLAYRCILADEAPLRALDELRAKHYDTSDRRGVLKLGSVYDVTLSAGPPIRAVNSLSAPFPIETLKLNGVGLAQLCESHVLSRARAARPDEEAAVARPWGLPLGRGMGGGWQQGGGASGGGLSSTVSTKALLTDKRQQVATWLNTLQADANSLADGADAIACDKP